VPDDAPPRDEAAGPDDGHRPGESETARVNRELIELLNELRVVLPGVQVLFAFLLLLPFSQGFTKVTHLQRDVYFLSFLCTTAATVLLIAPSAYHRLNFRRPDKEQMLFTSNRLAVAGTAFLAAALVCAVFVTTDVLLGSIWGSLVTAASAGMFAWFWYVLPLVRRARSG
jgi:hypothetical protein